MTLLQAATEINDITFRAMDVVLLVGGVISVISAFFIQRFQVQANRDRIQQLEKEIGKLETVIEKMGETHGEFKDKIFQKIDGLGEEIHKLALSIGELKIKKP